MGRDNEYLLYENGMFEDINKWRKNDNILASMVEELVRRSERLLDKSHPMYLEPENTDSFWWKSRIGTKQLVAVLWDLAVAAHIMKDNRYSDLALRSLYVLADYNMAENSGGSCYGKPFRTWWANPLDAGHAATYLGMTYDLLLPLFESKDRLMGVALYIKKFITALERFIKPGSNVYGSTLKNVYIDFQNMPMIGRFSMGVLAAVLEKAEIINADEYLMISQEAAMKYIDEGGHEDGILVEGPMYGFACLNYMAILGTILMRRGQSSVWSSRNWDKIVEAYILQLIPCDNTINPINDCYDTRCTAWLLATAKYRKNGLAKWLWNMLVQPLGVGRWDAPVAWDDIRASWWNASLPLALSSYDPSITLQNPDSADISKSHYFKVRGIVDIRTGWQQDDWYITLTCCPDLRWRSRKGSMHSQADRGHFCINALGEKFTIDNGYGNELFDKTTEVSRLGHTGEAHSVPLINGAMQILTTQVSGIQYVNMDSWAKVVHMRYAECYNGCCKVNRTIIVVPDHNGMPLYVVVYDSIIGSRNTIYGLPLHIDAANTVQIIDREMVDIIGGRKGNCCRVFMTANWPGKVSVDNYLGHPRIQYRCLSSSICALTILAPYCKDDLPSTYERTNYENTDGYILRVQTGVCRDVIAVCAEGTISGYGLETDAELVILRNGTKPHYVMIDGSYIISDEGVIYQVDGREAVVIQ